MLEGLSDASTRDQSFIAGGETYGVDATHTPKFCGNSPEFPDSVNAVVLRRPVERRYSTVCTSKFLCNTLTYSLFL